MAPMVTVRATGYVPLHERGESAEAAAARVRARLQEATRYLVQSNRHGIAETRMLFERWADEVPLDDARARIATHYGPLAAFHRLMFSPHPALDLDAAADLPAWTRGVLAVADGHLDRRLVWVAAVHRDTVLPHVHLVVGGADRDGRAFRLRPPLFAQLRDAGAAVAAEIVRVRDRRRTLGVGWE